MENCQIGVFLAYGSRRGAAFLDRELGHGVRRQGVTAGGPAWVCNFRARCRSLAVKTGALGMPTLEWQRLSAGDGSKGPRLYDWGWLPIRPWSEPGRGHWLLVRRSIADPEDLAYYACFGTGDVSLAELVRVAGTR